MKNRHMLQKQGKYRFGSIRKDFKGYNRWESNWKSGKIRNNPSEKDAWEKSLEAARKAWTSKHDPTHGAVFFVSKKSLGVGDKERIDPSTAKNLAKKAYNDLNLSIYPLEVVIPPKGHNFAHVFFRIKEK
ncbi:MAG: hypothetical protein J7L52_02100 [Thermotogae bacterium]|nr:hypothetical protein [Thermotogota bacterium]